MIRLILKFHSISNFQIIVILREYFSSIISEIEAEPNGKYEKEDFHGKVLMCQ